MAHHSPLAGLGPMMSPRRKRKVSDIASQMQPKRLSMGDTPVSDALGMRRFRRYLKPKLMRRHHIARLKHSLDELVKDDDDE